MFVVELLLTIQKKIEKVCTGKDKVVLFKDNDSTLWFWGKVNAILISGNFGMTLIKEQDVFGIIHLIAKLLNRNLACRSLGQNWYLRGERPKNNSQNRGIALNVMEPLVAGRMDSFGITSPEHKDSGRSMVELVWQIKSSSAKLLLFTLVKTLRNTIINLPY